MSPPGNAVAPPPLGSLTLRQNATDYPAINPDGLSSTGRGRNTLITGSGRGIGKSIAFAFAQAGYNVGITARNSHEVNSTVQEIQAEFSSIKAVGYAADLTQHVYLERLVDEMHRTLGPIDVLVCNAGTNTFMPFTMTNAEDWWYSLEINLKSPTELTRLLLPDMRERNTGTIIYTSSKAAVADLPWTTAYGAGKTGISRFAACLQNELDQMQRIDYAYENNGISLFSIHPGEIATSLHTTGFPERTHRDAPYIIEHMKALDAKRPQFDPSLPAWTCVYLASGKAAKLRGKYIDCTRDIEEYSRLF